MVISVILSAAGCGNGDEPERTPTPIRTSTPTPITLPTPTPYVEPCVPQLPIEGEPNLFHNPGFESGKAPWCIIHPPDFTLSEEQSHSGQWSAMLEMEAGPDITGSKVYYLVQELLLDEFPEFISGYYYVDEWVKSVPRQYLQFVVIAFSPENLPDKYSNYQIRYPLAGISEDPFNIANAFFVYIDTDEPATGEWVYFERNIRQDFIDLWGTAPENFTKLRILFEVRYDYKNAGEMARSTMYYDDLYIGDAMDNPNSP